MTAPGGYLSLGGSRLSGQRFAPEFKDEAVRQVIERGYPVAEVAQRLGVSAHSLYKCVKAVKPGKSEQSTFGVRSSSQFRAPRPYSSLTSLEYAMDVNEIAVLGKAGVSARSSDQTAIAFFWFENGSFAWNRIARKLSGGVSLMQHARLYAALNAALSDAIATTLESKFCYNFWRPLTATRAADTDGNPLTVKDPCWEPAFTTPPVPDYPSGYAAAGAAAAEVLNALVGANRPFQHTSTTAPGAGRACVSRYPVDDARSALECRCQHR